jgi:hypothetical protein
LIGRACDRSNFSDDLSLKARRADITNHAADVFVATLLAYAFKFAPRHRGLLRETSVRRTGRIEVIMLSLRKDSSPSSRREQKYISTGRNSVYPEG